MNAATIRKVVCFGFLFLFLFIWVSALKAQKTLTGFDLQVKSMAEDCKDEVQKELEKLISSNRLSLAQMFDTFYIPIPNTNPYLLQKYSRDTGEQLADLSVPIWVQGKHWGALRVGYKR